MRKFRTWRLVEGLLYFDANGHLQLNEDYHSHSWSRLLLDRFMEVLDPQGNVIFRNQKLNGHSLGGRRFHRRRRSVTSRNASGCLTEPMCWRSAISIRWKANAS